MEKGHYSSRFTHTKRLPLSMYLDSMLSNKIHAVESVPTFWNKITGEKIVFLRTVDNEGNDGVESK